MTTVTLDPLTLAATVGGLMLAGLSWFLRRYIAELDLMKKRVETEVMTKAECQANHLAVDEVFEDGENEFTTITNRIDEVIRGQETNRRLQEEGFHGVYYALSVLTRCQVMLCRQNGFECLDLDALDDRLQQKFRGKV